MKKHIAKIRSFIFLATFLVFVGNCLAQDGPYILYDKHGKGTIWRFDSNNIPDKTVFDHRNKIGDVNIVSEEGEFSFSLQLHKHWHQNSIVNSSPSKMVVISDPHGDVKSFVSILKATGVIDKNLGWSFGNGTLMVMGDVFDRGKDVLPIFWLIYKLEAEARTQKGNVTFLIGNHEDMVLRGDNRYVDEKYIKNAKAASIAHSELWNSNTELGRWLRSKNTIRIVGENMFVHAGVGEDFLKLDLPVKDVNKIFRSGIGIPKAERELRSETSKILFGTYGTIWYRGLVKDDPKYKPANEQLIGSILTKYKVKRIIVGHTVFKEVQALHNGKVITVNVDNQTNRQESRSRGLYIENGEIRTIYDSGEKRVIQSN